MIAAIITGATVILLCIAFIFSEVFECKSVAYFWDKTIKGGYCINSNSLSYGLTAANVATDFAVLVLPVPMLWGLQMKTHKKLAVILILGLGCLWVNLIVLRGSVADLADL